MSLRRGKKSGPSRSALGIAVAFALGANLACRPRSATPPAQASTTVVEATQPSGATQPSLAAPNSPAVGLGSEVASSPPAVPADIAPGAPAGGAPPALKAGPELERAAHWLEALRDHDMKALAARSAFPIEFRDTREEGHCDERRSAADPSSLARAVECLTQDELLLGLLRAAPVPPVESLPEGHVEYWAKQWRSDVPSGARSIMSHNDRTDAWITLVLWVDAKGVRAVWKTGTDVRAEVVVAERWRRALRNGDVAALTRLASYPFEVRDEGLNAHCQKGRTAKGPEQMPAALRCLLGDRVLHQALHDSPESGLEPERTTDRRPVAFEHWWRKEEHERLWSIWTLVGTKEGYEFDLTWLIAKDGVRAFWKRGSFVEP